MGAKQVTVSWVWVQEDTREEGITVHKSTDFRLPGLTTVKLARRYWLRNSSWWTRYRKRLTPSLPRAAMSSHYYTGCQDQACDLCDLCDAYAAGMDSAYKESD